MHLDGKTINFLGDSITEGVGTSSSEHIYASLIERDYHLKRANNYGISGTRFARQTIPSECSRYDLDFCSRVDEMDPNADAVVVFGGTNDFGHGDAPLGSPNDRTKDTFHGACHELFTRLLIRYPGKPIVICTPLHRLDEDDPKGSCKKYPVGTLQTYVDIITNTARYYGLPVLDLYGTSGIQPSVPLIQQALCPDGLHPNDAGHIVLASRVAGFLQTL